MLLEEKIKKSNEIIIQASKKWHPEKTAIAWTAGKDSTILLHLVRKVFKGKIPFRVMFNDSTLEFPEIYNFVNKLKKDWKLDLLWIKHLPEDLEAYKKSKDKEKKMRIMQIAKINTINYALSKYNFRAFMSGIRWDEHPARAKEKYFSPRTSHTRIHPILHFTLSDVWQYIDQCNVPYVSLYNKGYKSLGEAPFTQLIKKANAAERAGREATKERIMHKLRKLGYW